MRVSLMTPYFPPLVSSCAAIKSTRSGTNSRARAKEDWRDMELILLAKIVKMEADIRAAQVELDTVGMMVENKRGTQIQNPLISVIDTLERRQLDVIRSMSLNQTAHDPRSINGSAKVESEARAALKAVGVAGLTAQPVN